MSTAPTLLFDLDGTLADTARDLCHTMNVLLERYGRTTVPEAQVRNMVGAGARALLDRGFKATGEAASEDLLDQAFDDFISYYSAHIADHTVLFPGLESQLDKFASTGINLGVCTNKPEGLSHQLLGELGIDRYFGVVIGGDTLPVRKPDPTPLLEAVSRLGGDRSSTIMIGDSASDIDAALAADMGSVCVTFGYTETPAEDLGASVLIDHFDDLGPALQALLPDHF